MQNNMPQHPGRQEVAAQQQPQQGLAPNPYFRPSPALEAANLQQAQAGQAIASADHANAQAAMLQQAQAGLGNLVQEGPITQPQDVQAQQVASALAEGSISPEQLQLAIQNGEIDQATAEAAMGMAQQMQAQSEAQYAQAQQQGLGGF